MLEYKYTRENPMPGLHRNAGLAFGFGIEFVIRYLGAFIKNC
jgi:hypothetical protein